MSRNTMRALVFYTALALDAVMVSALSAQEPSFDCDKAVGAVEEMICADSTLASLDVRLSEVWHQVLARSQDNVDLDLIKAEQRSWVKGRNECWKSDDVRECIETSYELRIAELQVRWSLVPAQGPFFFVCNENPANEVVATLFETEPPAALLERGDESVVVYLQPFASGARYEGRNVTFWTRDDEALLTWGWDADEMGCRLRKRED
jgi:uncharacterized protein